MTTTRRSCRALIWLLLLAAVPAAAAPLILSGTVARPDGAPLAGARILLLPLPSSHEWGRMALAGRAAPELTATATADADGGFRLATPRAGLWTVVAEAPGRVPVQLSPLIVVESTGLPPALLPEDAGFHFQVTRKDGTPAAGLWIHAAGESPGPWKETAAWGWVPRTRLGLTGADGALVLPRAPRERLTVRVLDGGSEAARMTGLEGGGLILPAAVSSVVTGALGERTLEVRGADGRPVADVLVRLGDVPVPAAVTDAAGRARFPSAAGSAPTVRLLAADGRRWTGLLSAGSATPAITLPPPVVLEGRAIDSASRQPLAEALVWLSSDPGAFARTDVRGAYRIVPIVTTEGDAAQIRAAAAGHLPILRRLGGMRGGGSRGPALSLDPAAAAAGTVVDGAGKPLAGARVQAVLRAAPRQRTFSRSGEGERHTASGPDGRFRLSGLLAGATWEIRASRPGRAPARISLPILTPISARDLRLVLGPGRNAAGRVVDRAEKPVAGAEITLLATTGEHAPANGDGTRRRGEEGIDLWKATTGPDGRFAVAGLPLGAVDLRAAKPGLVPVTVRALAIPGGPGGPAGDAPFDLGTVILEPGAEVRGIVIDRDGRPVEGAEVHAAQDLRRLRFALESGGPVERRPETVTGADGRFAIADLRRGDRVDLVVRGRGLLPASVSGVRAPNAQPVRVVLERGAQVTGRVVDAEKRPVAGAELSLQMDRPGEEKGLLRLSGGARAAATSDADGRFSFAPVPAGRGALGVNADGFQPIESRELAVPAAGIADLELVLDSGAVLEGRVFTADGEPVEDARVVSGAAASISDADGVYRLEGVPPGRRKVQLRHREFPPLDKDFAVESGVNSLDLILPAGHEVAGRVVDRDGRPVSGAGLALFLDGSPREQEAVGGEDGAFSFPRVADGVYTLRAEREGYRTSETASAVRVAGAPRRDLEVRLDRGTRIAGRLLGLDLYDLAEVEVRAAREDGSGETPGRVSYDGAYEVTGLDAGDWVVTATLRGGEREGRGRALLEPGAEEAKLDIELGRGLTLTGRVIYGGAPLAGADLTLRGLDVSGFRPVTTDWEGGFRLADLRPGSYRLQVVSRREMLNHSEDLRLDADRDVDVEIAAARVAGTVVEASSSAPLDGALVGLRRLAGGEAAFLIAIGTDREGEFVLPAVTEGRYRMTVTKDGYSPDEREMDVTAAAALDDLRIALRPAAGLALDVRDVRDAAGGRPPWVRAAVLDAAGRQTLFEVRAPDASGLVRLATVPAGTWEVLLIGPGSAPVAVRVKVPSKPVPVILPAGGRLTVRIPSLLAADQAAVLVLTDGGGTPFRAPSPYGTVQTQWTMDGGKAVVEGVPAGEWRLRAVAPDGRSWERTLATPGADLEISLE